MRTERSFAAFARGLRVQPDLLQTAKERGWNHALLARETLFERRASATVPEQLHDQLFNTEVRAVRIQTAWEQTKYARLYAGEVHRVPAAFAVEIPQARMHVLSGAVFTEEGDYFPQSVFVPAQFFDSKQERLCDPPPTLPGTHLSVATPWCWNYAHWLFDSLPKLGPWPQHSSGTRLTLPANPLPFQTESLRLLGVSPEQLTETDSPIVHFEKLLFTCAGDRSGLPHPELLVAMRNRLLEGAGISDPIATGRPVYISRRHRSKSRSQRRILNEAEVVRVLEAFGFEVYVPEEHPFLEQVRRFATAPAIACAHGAGSYNQLFAPRGIPLIELFNPACWEHSAVRFASLLDQPHHHLFGRNRTAEHDFEVDCERLRRLTAKAMGGEHLAICAEREY